jgi:hypothetical protein
VNAEKDQHVRCDFFVDQARDHVGRPASEPRHRRGGAIKVDERHRPVHEEPARKLAIQEFDVGVAPVTLDPPKEGVDFLLLTLD